MAAKPTYEELENKVSELERLNKKLSADEKKYRTLFDHAGVGISLIDAETFKFIEFNTKTHERLGPVRSLKI